MSATTNPDFMGAVTEAVAKLLRTKRMNFQTGKVESVMELPTVEDALNEAIDLGGGFTLHGKYGPYWVADYRVGIKLTVGKIINGEYINEKVPRALVLKIAREQVAAAKGQLSLF